MANVLVVDDSIIMRRNIKTFLNEAGHTVIGEATDGIEAISVYEKLKPDIVTMDIKMAKLNGIEAVKQIISLYPNAKIIMISTVDQNSSIYEAIKSGAKYYIVKPIDLEKIKSSLELVLSN